MANADRHKMGSAAQGKGTGTGAMTDLPEGILEENMVLSNRDKSRHNDERGLDSKMVQTEQYQDHAANREIPPDAIASGPAGNTTGLANTKTDLAGAQGSLGRQDKPR
ncbi:hypothetical protein ASF49_14940 [Methylobacterium sp. Leaf104]|uniref:hypothetical protein n=1 Tax=Methylobacterium TaxID=407 RepID=UPI000702152A|nr:MULTISPECIES: hypothetical protein [Methylobacterium]KQP29965.1 hypothetical protein ASF49_14940 [Methylobacterium sp. Leaf104]MCI9882334.1 hypothetical protein [Methylobacterium goesingense]